MSIENRQRLSRRLEEAFPSLEFRPVYRGVEISHPHSGSDSWILIRNDRRTVSYNARTGVRYVSRPGPEGAGWVAKLGDMISRRIEKIWGAWNE